MSRARIATLVAVLVVGCSDRAQMDLSGMPEFCQEVLPRVAEFMAGFEQPTGERYGGTAVVGSIGEIANGMNALVSSDYTASQHQEFVNLMTLLRLDANLVPQPYLAESWELDGDSVLTFHLRDDVMWHDGTPTTARDVEFTYLRATDPATAFPNTAWWTHYVKGPDGVEVLDDHTVRLRMRPHSDLLDPWRATAIMPAHLLEDVPPAELAQHPYGTRCPVGNGPFVFGEHRPDESWTFVRNPGFPEALGGPPYLDRYVYRVVPEQTTLLTELLTENIDYYIAPPADQAPQIQAASQLEFRDFEFRTYTYVGWNSRRPQLADPLVRRALTLATNRAQIVEALFRGYGEVANSGVPPYHWAFNPMLRDSLRYDPVEARRLLDQAGWVDRNGDGIRENAQGLQLDISIKYNQGNQDRQDIAEIMQAQLREVGVAARPQVVEWATLLNQINTPTLRDFDGVVIGWVTDFKLDDRDLFHSTAAETPYGFVGTKDAELDRYIDELPLVVERAEATRLWHEYQNRLLAVHPYTFLFFPRRLAGLNRRLQGVILDARGEWVSIAGWWIPEAQRR